MVVVDGEEQIIIRCQEHQCQWWCGLSDTENEGSWVNANTEEVTMMRTSDKINLTVVTAHQEVDLVFTIWEANEPNGREFENCIETRLKSFPNGTIEYLCLPTQD